MEVDGWVRFAIPLPLLDSQFFWKLPLGNLSSAVTASSWFKLTFRQLRKSGVILSYILHDIQLFFTPYMSKHSNYYLFLNNYFIYLFLSFLMLGPRETGHVLQPANVLGPGWWLGPCAQRLQLHVVRCLCLCPFFFFFFPIIYYCIWLSV